MVAGVSISCNTVLQYSPLVVEDVTLTTIMVAGVSISCNTVL